ncbi:universal stress protein [Synechococcus moorigangaii CMS01]|nr:universal stress protein [Synechococcus moorigangaii CMS01]
MSQILLCTDGSDFAKVSYSYGAWLGDRLGAAIHVLHVTDARGRAAAEARNFSGSIGLGTSESLLQELIDLEHQKAKLDHQRAKIILQEAQTVLKGQGISQVKLLHEAGFLLDCVQALEASHDVLMIAKRGETANFAAAHLGANTERLLRSTKKPCLVTPRQFKLIERIVIAYDDSPSCQRLLQFFTKSPAFQNLEIHVLTVTKNRDYSPIDPRLENAKRQLEDANISATYHLATGNSEEAIAQYLQEHQGTLLMMGAYGHNRIRQFIVGSTTIQVLRNTQAPVLVFR